MVTVAIQAGGKSSRMGRDKALIRLAGRPLIEHVLSQVQGLGEETIITTNTPDRLAYLGLRMASDQSPVGGALQGLRTALRAASHPRVLVVACDMPFLRRPLLEHLLHLSQEDADVVVPKNGRFYEPLHAVYQTRVLPEIEASLEAGRFRLDSFFPRVDVLPVVGSDLDRLDPQRRSFFNVNTPEDLERARAIAVE
jgi:molybdopterin-guanine dinucleotide biosynthesis protein A